MQWLSSGSASRAVINKPVRKVVPEESPLFTAPRQLAITVKAPREISEAEHIELMRSKFHTKELMSTCPDTYA